MEFFLLIVGVLCCPVFSILLMKDVLVRMRSTPARPVFYILPACEFISLLVLLFFIVNGNPAALGISIEQHLSIIFFSALAVIGFFIVEVILYLVLIKKYHPHQ